MVVVCQIFFETLYPNQRFGVETVIEVLFRLTKTIITVFAKITTKTAIILTIIVSLM